MQTHEAASTEERAVVIGENIARLQQQMATVAADAGREPQSVRLHGATKGVEPERILAAIQHGLTHFGENWVQEAAPKITQANVMAEERGIAVPTWHMIGHLQRNKARQALEIFRAIDTIDSLRLAETVNQRAEQMDIALIDVLIEVDFTGKPERGGFKMELGAEREQVARFMEAASRIIELPRLNVIGLMTVGPMAQDPEESRRGFRRLRELRDALNDASGATPLRELSMGMTNDFHVAIQEGATIVRLGTAIFGPRPAGRTY